MKIIINRKYGGFGLSVDAIMMLADLKGLQVTPTKNEWGSIEYWANTAWFGKYRQPITHKEFLTLSEADRQDYIAHRNQNIFDYRTLPRHDKDLVHVVETLGEAANGEYANLKIYERDWDEDDYTINEYDGMEELI
jgi:hypothetical protein